MIERRKERKIFDTRLPYKSNEARDSPAYASSDARFVVSASSIEANIIL